MTDLTGRVALVTGASSGLGRHFAQVLAARGATVIAAARREAALEALAAEIVGAGGLCHPVVIDVTDADSVAAGIARGTDLAGPIGIVVNNAGVAQTQAAIDLSPADWRGAIEPNLTGAFLVAQAAARTMRDSGGGTIVNVASILGERVSKGLAAYAASKAGLIQLTKALALEWASLGVRVNALAPGYVETDLNRAFFATEAGARLVARIRQRRLGRLSDLDGPLLLLCSDASRYMTGAVIAVDGGHLVSGL
ncbi:MAG: SDR family oxidoreductase [Caulobacter sp.]|nr:SDR family oxidoreductase [Caulobacter sp.]